MPYPPCSQDHCSRPGVISDFNCPYCGLNFCDEHRTIEHHACLSLPKDEKKELYIKQRQQIFRKTCAITRNARLAAKASLLRNGQPCSVSIPKSSKDAMAGWIHYHFPISFDDGVEWLARVRKVSLNRLQNCTVAEAVSSEYATIRMLQSVAKGLVPMARLPARNSDDPAKEPHYLFVENVKGRPCKAPFSPRGIPRPNESYVDNAIRSYAAFLIRLSGLSFDSIGSLFLDVASETFRVGPMISYIFRQTEKPKLLGPFPTMRDRFIAQIDFVLKRIEDCVYLTRDQRVPLYLMHLEYRSIVERCEAMGENERFYIKHGDDKGDHIMADEEGNLVAVIDWELAYTTSLTEAFAAPNTLIDYELFWDSAGNELSRDERSLQKAFKDFGRPDLAECVVKGKGYRRLFDLIGHDIWSYAYLKSTSDSLLGDGQCGDYQSSEEWLRGAEVRYQGHVGLEKVKAALLENTSFPNC